jgi:RNA polymerase sigma-70 factor (ECF subfamily)
VTSPDAEIIARVLAGEPDAYRILVTRYHERFARFAYHLLGDREDAEEALQDSFLRAYRALGRYQDRERFAAWFCRILMNRCRTMAGRRGRREQHEDGAGMQRSISTEASEDRLAWREEIGWALAQLEHEQREAFLLKHVEDLSYEEMAALTGAGVSALKMRVKRAADRMRELLTNGTHA